MVKGAYNETFSAFYFNLHAEVGPNCPNRGDDVELVRYGIACLAKWPGNQKSAEGRQFCDLARQVGPTGPFDTPLASAILACQRANGLTTDGKVSLVRGDFAPSGRSYILQIMNAAIRIAATSVFPRIDLVPESGAALSQVVRRMFVGSL